MPVSSWLRGRALWDARQCQLHEPWLLPTTSFQSPVSRDKHQSPGRRVASGVSCPSSCQRSDLDALCGLRLPLMKTAECCCIKGTTITLPWSCTGDASGSATILALTLPLPYTGTCCCDIIQETLWSPLMSLDSLPIPVWRQWMTAAFMMWSWWCLARLCLCPLMVGLRNQSTPSAGIRLSTWILHFTLEVRSPI